MKIFISYAREYRERAEELAIALRQEGHEVFFDRDDLPPGQGYHARIRAEIAECDMFVFLVAPESVEEGAYTLTEVGLASKRWPDASDRVLPVMAAPTSYESIPAYVQSVTVLEPKGNLVADVLARVATMEDEQKSGVPTAGSPIGIKDRHGPGWLPPAVVLGVAAVIGVVWWIGRPSTPVQDCYLWVEVSRSMDELSAAGSRPTLQVAGGGAARQFILSASGPTAVDVSGAQLDAWTLSLTDGQGNVLADYDLEGCPTGTEELGSDGMPPLVLRSR